MKNKPLSNVSESPEQVMYRVEYILGECLYGLDKNGKPKWAASKTVENLAHELAVSYRETKWRYADLKR